MEETNKMCDLIIQIKDNFGLLLGIIVLSLTLVVAIFSSQIAPYDPYGQNLTHNFEPPTTTHLFGTDSLGRDVFSRVIAGTPISFMIVAQVLLITLIIGMPLGLISGYMKGYVDSIIMRIADIFFAFPSFLMAMAITTALGPSLQNAMTAVAIAFWPRYARLIRGQVLDTGDKDFVESARAAGASNFRIVLKHILPNCFSPILVQLTMDSGYAILTTAALSFVGLGAQPPTPEWGRMIATNRIYITSRWWIPFFPGLAISIVVGGYMLLGDGLRDLFDPKLKRAR